MLEESLIPVLFKKLNQVGCHFLIFGLFLPWANGRAEVVAAGSLMIQQQAFKYCQ